MSIWLYTYTFDIVNMKLVWLLNNFKLSKSGPSALMKARAQITINMAGICSQHGMGESQTHDLLFRNQTLHYYTTIAQCLIAFFALAQRNLFSSSLQRINLQVLFIHKVINCVQYHVLYHFEQKVLWIILGINIWKHNNMP